MEIKKDLQRNWNEGSGTDHALVEKIILLVDLNLISA